MRIAKRVLSILMVVTVVGAMFAGCSSNQEAKYSDTVCIIGYTQSAAPFLEVDDKGKATGFFADLWAAIFDSVKGDLKSYVFEQVDECYNLEEDGGFVNPDGGKEYSASLLMGAVYKNHGTINEDYSFTQPIITNRVITVTAKDSKIKNYANLGGHRVVVVGDTANKALELNSKIAGAIKPVGPAKDLDAALDMLDTGKADAVVVDEITFMPDDRAENYAVLDKELDTVEYYIACKKYSGWKDSINEAIHEQKSEKYGDGDTFTPLVEKYFGYNASSFSYETAGDN